MVEEYGEEHPPMPGLMLSWQPSLVPGVQGGLIIQGVPLGWEKLAESRTPCMFHL